jgi:hypothetical protein
MRRRPDPFLREIEAIYVTVIEPNSSMVRMVDTLAGTRRQGKSEHDIDPTGCDERKEHRLFAGYQARCRR